MMSLYRISQNKNGEYNTYDSAVVVANSPEDAATIHPNGEAIPSKNTTDDWYYPDSSWVLLPSDVKVEFLGLAWTELPRGVVCASFNAG